MYHLIHWFVHNPVASNLLMGVLIVAGLLALPNTHQEEFPNIEIDAIAALPEDQSEVVALRYTGGLSYPEIAARLDVPLSTVQGRLKRARQVLRQQLMAEVTP